MNVAFLFIVLLQTATRVSAADPKALLQAINAQGARMTVDALASDSGQWDRLLRAVARGNSSWLKVAAVLISGADGGAASELELTLGEALEHNAAAVLRIAVPALAVSTICGKGPDIDDPRYDSFERAIAAVERRAKRVRAVVDGQLAARRSECLEDLEKSKAGIARFYGR
jgi:hypothetical protein